MGYVQIETIRYDSNPQKTAEFTRSTVGSLIERLSKYDKDLPVIIEGQKEFELIGRIEQK